MIPLDQAKDSRGTAILFTIFAATGIGLVLPGTLLPLLLARWSMNDAQGGTILFLFFLGTMAGALLTRGSLPFSIARGGVGIGIGTFALANAGRDWAFAAFAVYGFGLGIAMTSISVLQSRRFPRTRPAQMARLNLAWAVGAFAGPATLLHSAAARGIGTVLYAVGAFFVVAGVVAAACVAHAAAEPADVAANGKRRLALPLLLLAAVPLATGVESSMGGWLTTYARRGGATLNFTVGAVTCFWAGMLLSRLLQSNTRLAEATQKVVLRGSPWLMAAAVLIVIAFRDDKAMLGGAFLLGFAIGPVYPLLLALVLHRGEGGNLVFVAGGVGGASLPLLTGLLSQSERSLRAGLAVPLVASLLLAALAWTLPRRLKSGI